MMEKPEGIGKILWKYGTIKFNSFDTLAKKCKIDEYEEGIFRWNMDLSSLGPKVGKVTYYDINKIKTALDEKNAAIIEYSFYNKDKEFSSHYVFVEPRIKGYYVRNYIENNRYCNKLFRTWDTMYHEMLYKNPTDKYGLTHPVGWIVEPNQPLS